MNIQAARVTFGIINLGPKFLGIHTQDIDVDFFVSAECYIVVTTGSKFTPE